MGLRRRRAPTCTLRSTAAAVFTARRRVSRQAAREERELGAQQGPPARGTRYLPPRPIRSALSDFGWRVEIDEIPVRVTEVNGTSSPRLRGGGLDPGFYQAL